MFEPQTASAARFWRERELILVPETLKSFQHPEGTHFTRTTTTTNPTKTRNESLVVYHSVYGHVLQLARAAEEGVKSVSGVEAVFRRAPEFPHTEKELEAGKWPRLEDVARSKEYSGMHAG